MSVCASSNEVSTNGTAKYIRYTVPIYLLSIIAIIGIFANLMVIIVFIKCKIHRRSFTYLMVLQQSFLDMIVCLIYLCFYNYYPAPNINFAVYCKFGTFFFFFLSASALNLVFISVERYIAVVHPLKYWIRDNQKRKTLPKLCIPLVAAFLITFQYAFILEEDPALPGTCTFCYKNEGIKILSGTFILLTNWAIPIFTMTFCYYHVYITLKKKQPKIRKELTMQAHTKGAGDESAVEINISPSQANRKDKAHDAQRNFIITMSINTLVYSICITPVILMYVVYTVCNCFDITNTAHESVFLIAAINNIMNPFVYLYKLKDFKEAFSKTFCRKC
ncbi:octopamine receptor beta-2R-like [Anneissia japonica]|uniref:octopamine receptor beta-2R-like n=1 Tax=Anneissia japonica TaxID=1529436 RepID=UPI0014259E54|nr:octopamine receptor beta-2R-like [Anneissia japonica]